MEKVSYLQPTYAGMLACFVLVNNRRLALLCLPSGFPESLCGEPRICYTDTTTLCWREHRSAGKWSLFLLKLDQHSLPFNLDSSKNIYHKLDNSMNRKIRHRETFHLGLGGVCSVWKINNVSGSQGSEPASQTTTGHAADLLHLLPVVTRTFGSKNQRYNHANIP